MISKEQIQTFQVNGATVVGTDGDKIGKLGELYLEDHTDEPSWMTVKTGLFGTSETFVPLDKAAAVGQDTIEVPYTKDFIKDAPRADVDQHLSPEEERNLFRYYEQGDHAGTDQDGHNVGRGQAFGTGEKDTTHAQGQGTAGTRAKDARGDEASVVRSEEDVHVGTQRREAGKVRLRKYVVTEHVTKTVPVQHEEVRVEREPITGETTDAQIGEDEAEVTLHKDEVVVDKETKPVERVSLGTDAVTEERTVEEQVRKERVDIDDDEHQR